METEKAKSKTGTSKSQGGLSMTDAAKLAQAKGISQQCANRWIREEGSYEEAMKREPKSRSARGRANTKNSPYRKHFRLGGSFQNHRSY